MTTEEGHNIDNYPLVTTPGVEESTNVSIPTTYNMIVAMCWGGGIGNNNELPWSRIKKDIRHFIRVTSSKHDQSRKNAVIMGHTTWKSIPEQNRPLKYRDNLILTSMLHDKPANTDDVRWFNNIDDIKLYCKQMNYETVWIIGGSSVYRLFLYDRDSIISSIFITYIHRPHYDYTTVFPPAVSYKDIAQYGVLCPNTTELFSWRIDNPSHDIPGILRWLNNYFCKISQYSDKDDESDADLTFIQYKRFIMV
jgi:dihydrofolate reductase